MDDEKFVEALRSFLCLWLVSSKSYKDLRAKENAWKEVASKVSTHESYYLKPDSLAKVKDRACPHSYLSSTPSFPLSSPPKLLTNQDSFLFSQTHTSIR